jgi:predicted nucleic acid-binding protein
MALRPFVIEAAAAGLTMFEPGVVDTNVLVYALDADAPQCAAARALLEAGRDPANTFYVTAPILGEFYAIVTNSRRVAKPRRRGDHRDFGRARLCARAPDAGTRGRRLTRTASASGS